MKRFILGIITILCTVFVYADIPANTNKFVNDFANVMDKSDVQTLENRLRAYSDSTTNQICIVTVNSLDGKAPAEYAQELGQKWGVGQKGKDNGVIILVKPKQLLSKGEVFIATGYGMEGVLPDAICKRIIERKMIPLFKENKYDAAIKTAVNEIILILDNDPESMTNKKEEIPTWVIIVGIILLILIIWAIADEDSLPGVIMYALLDAAADGGGDGGSSSSFGGGSFGGGGAGGSW